MVQDTCWLQKDKNMNIAQSTSMDNGNFFAGVSVQVVINVTKTTKLKAVCSSTNANCTLFGVTQDKLIQSTIRGFKGGDFFEKIRHRPSAALMASTVAVMRSRSGEGS